MIAYGVSCCQSEIQLLTSLKVAQVTETASKDVKDLELKQYTQCQQNTPPKRNSACIRLAVSVGVSSMGP